MGAQSRSDNLTPYIDALIKMVEGAGLTPTVELNDLRNQIYDTSVTNVTIRGNPLYQIVASALAPDNLEADCKCITFEQWGTLLDGVGGSGGSIEIPEGGIPINMDKYLLFGGTASPDILNLADVTPSALKIDIFNGGAAGDIS